MFNFIKKLYLFIIKVFIVILGGVGITLGLYYPLSLLMGTNAIFPYLIGGLGGVIYAIGFLEKLTEGDFE